MNKKNVFLFFPVLIVGVFIGHAGKNMFRTSADAGAKPAEERVAQSPRFGEVRPVEGRGIRAARPDTANTMKLDDSLKQCFRMNTEELLAELEKWNKLGINGGILSGRAKPAILLSYICSRLGKEAPKQSLAYWVNRDDDSYSWNILCAWCDQNPEAAMAYCRERMEDGTEGGMWSQKYIELLSDQSPEKALDYLLTCSPEVRREHMSYPLSCLARKTPEKLPEILEKLKSGVKRDREFDTSIARLLAKYNWSAVEQLINTAPQEGREEVLGSAIASLPQEEALEKLKTLDESSRISVLKHLADEISSTSHVKALEFIQNNATEEQAVKILEKGYHSLDMYDTEVRSYLDKMQAGSVKDCILGKAIENFSRDSDNPFFDRKMQEAFPLIDQMSTSEKKEEVTDILLDNWRYEDPQAAKSWAEQSSWPEDKKKEFIRRCDEALKPAQDDE